MKTVEHYTLKQVEAAIAGTGGIKLAIAAHLKCHRHTVDRYLRLYATLRQAYDDESQAVGDLAETELIKLIKAGDADSIKFYLSRKCKDRGYAERHEISGPDAGPIAIEIEQIHARVLNTIARAETGSTEIDSQSGQGQGLEHGPEVG